MQDNRFKLTRKISLIIIMLAAIYIGNVVFFPYRLPNKTYKVIINKDQNLHQIATILENDKVISNQHIFLWILHLLGKDRKVSAGLYVINNNVSMWDVITRIVSGHPDQISVTIVDGLRFAEIKNYIDTLDNIKHLTTNMSEKQLKNLLKIPSPNLEGAFYPSTYFIAPGQSDLEIYHIAYNMMQNKLNSIFLKRSPIVHYQTPYQMLILASLIQKETSKKNDMFQIATVFNNRLGLKMRLQDDPSVFYGLHNKEKISRNDFSIDTPYNTYLHSGLPPTPICTPSEEALLAASDPMRDSTILYFIATKSGDTKFAPTYQEHKKMLKKYWKKQP